jgi:anti-anti-sigma factor
MPETVERAYSSARLPGRIFVNDITFPAGLIPDFEVEITQGEGEVTVRFSGDLHADHVAERLQPPLLKMHEAILARKVSRVRLDLRKVDYMNSSAIKALASWLLAAERAREGGYRIDMIFNPDSTWQHESLGALEAIAPKVTRRVPSPG